MHILIADIGSTKSIWTVLNKDSHESYQTIGFNPNYQSKEEISAVFSNVKSNLNINKIGACYLYGAGIDSKDSMRALQDICSQQLPSNIDLFLENDLLAAARCCFNDNESGVIAILGTGSNIRSFNKGKLTGESKSLGYILGDEGGGVGFGKHLVRAFIYGDLSPEIEQILSELNHTKSSIINSVYNEAYPQKYLANFVRIIYPHRYEPSIKLLIEKNFSDFITSHVLKIEDIQNKDLKFVGSMAYYFEDILIETAKKHNITIKHCYQNPMEGLIDYHKNNI